MRSSTLLIVPFYFLAGLVAASADKAHDIELDFEGPPSGWVCCDAGAEDADGACKAKGLNAFCCGPFKADKKRPGKGNSGCDPFFATVPTGRDVKFLNGFCTAGGDLPGHVGCA
ncbi:hypothetical protein MGG_10732 [Pyricularia oryzae 70-15]|uniref:Uncharacterized protein n=3 Tax=Pyricularia oryzae TaxID=318829 RepID=G4MXG2_PYRO7|nr:uncharacterized protein MGG_10732 [Pyricularia oryzae 70-15]ELQ35936.1 hypothetical protein OOU_Y34scaffold00679g19 [Pyricularia oryzae Y34]KAI6593478.1 hypothetical protein MCOR06_003771 [Pyricularia oryzae]EHA53492.1 hypothetical protein MGG_10732 [Pyricularia oryzae 70-15]KAI7914780.1 hypothetical protein M9X92_008837 [Pyricularia oryzae]KAI7917455.1 hypothetical protein M0657_008097 [Pyricularia oryzae]